MHNEMISRRLEISAEIDRLEERVKHLKAQDQQLIQQLVVKQIKIEKEQADLIKARLERDSEALASNGQINTMLSSDLTESILGGLDDSPSVERAGHMKLNLGKPHQGGGQSVRSKALTKMNLNAKISQLNRFKKKLFDDANFYFKINLASAFLLIFPAMFTFLNFLRYFRNTLKISSPLHPEWADASSLSSSVHTSLMEQMISDMIRVVSGNETTVFYGLYGSFVGLFMIGGFLFKQMLEVRELRLKEIELRDDEKIQKGVLKKTLSNHWRSSLKKKGQAMESFEVKEKP